MDGVFRSLTLGRAVEPTLCGLRKEMSRNDAKSPRKNGKGEIEDVLSALLPLLSRVDF